MMLNLLPHEILAEILSRLPVKSLGRVRCVCKVWLSLISDPTFAILLQHKLASRGPRVLISSSSGLHSLDCSKASFTDDGALVNLDFPLKNRDAVVSIIGSCNDLVCIAVNEGKDFFLWNPSIGVYKKLPEFGFSDISMHGFGYDSSTNDYKVFCTHLSYNGCLRRNKHLIFSTKTDSWRKIKTNCRIQCCDVYCTQQRSVGSLLNETLHWLAVWNCQHGRCLAISAFDLKKEKFFKVPMPRVACKTELNNFTMLSVLDGCLCLIHSESPDGNIELRMMKEYGVQFSWVKLFRIAENFHEFNYMSWLLPLCFTTSSEVILLNNQDELLRVNPKERTVESMKISRYQLADATVYVESLLAPNVFL